MESFGLFLLRERLSWIGGKVSIDSNPGAGCKVELNLPIETGLELQNQPRSSQVNTAKQKHMPSLSKTKNQGPVRIVLADDHTIVREGLIQILKKDEQFDIVGEAADGETAVALADELKPDVVLMDISMPGIGGIEATRLIKQAHPEIQVIALSMHEESERGSEMHDAGAAAYINKSRAASTIGDAIRSCCAHNIQK